MGDTAAHLGPGALLAGRFLLGPRRPGPLAHPVHLARDTAADGPGAGAPLAVRLVAAEDPSRFLERAARAQAAARRSPVADDVLAFGVQARQGWLVTRHLDAPDALARVERDGLLAPAHAVRVVEALADALHRVHACGFVHLGVGPAEVLLPAARADGVRLTGFGAHPCERRVPSRLTAARWTAPERLDGRSGPVDQRADVFGLAAVLGHLALGHWPGEPRPVRPELEPAIEDALWALLQRGLSSDPRHRPASAPRLAGEARAGLIRAARAQRRRRRARARRVAGVAALAGAGVLVATGVGGEPPGAAQPRAPQPAERAFVAELAPVLEEAQAAARAFDRRVLARSASRPVRAARPARLLARNRQVLRRRERAARRIAALRAPTAAARRAQELALTVLDGRLDHQRLLADELEAIPAGLTGRPLHARYAAARIPLRQLDRYVGMTSRTALTDAWNGLLRRTGHPSGRPVDL